MDKGTTRPSAPLAAAAQTFAAVALRSLLEEVFTPPGHAATEILLVCQADPGTGAEHGCLQAAARLQAQRLAARLASPAPAALYAGPSAVAGETAGILGGAWGLPVSLADDLRAVCWSPGDRVAAETARALESGMQWSALPGAEPRRVFRLRVLAAMERIAARRPGGRIAVVADASVINTYLAALLGLPFDVFFLPRPLSLSAARLTEGVCHLELLNDTSHLRDREPMIVRRDEALVRT